MKTLDVRLQLNESDSRLVGTLAEADRRLYFEYCSDFLADPLWLSPFSNKYRNDINKIISIHIKRLSQ